MSLLCGTGKLFAFSVRSKEVSQLDAQVWQYLVSFFGPAQPQPQNCKASLLYLTSGGVGFTGMEVRTDVVGTGEAHELVCEIWWCL